ncbi:hypothetical protein [uncultured Bradyrhizobium sp.]|uniref:hypothetical protein n=1 Tax=Bradyrhizobium sp. TaxID=376 RepID=UPI0026261993|nr:hypothetical protein [uncultured Bradyrhizobium sp.]
MEEKFGAGAYAESLGNCCADAREQAQTPTSTTSAATHARAKRRFNPGSGFQLIDIIHLLAASEGERQPFRRRHNHGFLSVLRMHRLGGSRSRKGPSRVAAS